MSDQSDKQIFLKALPPTTKSKAMVILSWWAVAACAQVLTHFQVENGQRTECVHEL